MTTVATRLIARLRELGVEDLFGVPADYNLAFLDEVYASELGFVGTCNELGAAYAADGYARLRGAGALLTTFGVGELSAVNGIGGAYAESVPVVEIVGAPSTRAVDAGLPMHHTMADGDFGRFERLHAEVTCDRVTLSAEHAGEEMDRVLRACWEHKRPVRIALPVDVVHAPAAAPEEPLLPEVFRASEELREAFRTEAAKLLAGATRTAVLADHLVARHGAHEALADLIAAGPLPAAAMNMGKGVVDESAPTFAGMYVGAASAPVTRAIVEQADCLVTVGVLISDGNSGGFTHAFPVGRTIEVGPYDTRIGDRVFRELHMTEALAILTDIVKDADTNTSTNTDADGGAAPAFTPPELPAPVRVDAEPHTPLTQAVLGDRLAALVRPGDVVVAEQGTAFFGVVDTRMPAGVDVVSQVLWSSIGYTLPAALGTCVAAPDRRTLLVIGDGSLQLTAQEIGTMARVGAAPVILVLNNGGYTIERAIHPTEAPYNDIAPWRYTDLPAAFGAGDRAVARRATTPAELDAALAEAERNRDRLVLIEAVLDPEDYPGRLAAIAAKYRPKAAEAVEAARGREPVRAAGRRAPDGSSRSLPATVSAATRPHVSHTGGVRMRAALFHEAGSPLAVAEVAVAAPGPGEVLVATAAAGLCHSDIHLLDGKIPMAAPSVLGHEASGVVLDVGPGVTRVVPGDHVIACLSVFCGRCALCLRGETWICQDKQAVQRAAALPPRLALPDGTAVGANAGVGGLAERMLLHENAVVSITKDMPLDVAAIIGCAVTTGVGAAFNTADIRAGETVAVIGCGGIGLNIVQGARLRGAGRVVAVDLIAAKRELALAVGATDAADDGPVASVTALTGGLGADHVFDAVGSPATTAQAVAMTRPGGSVYIVGIGGMAANVEIPGYALWGQGKSVRGVHMGSNNFTVDMPRYVDLYLQGRLHLDELVARRISLDEVNDGYEALRVGETARSVVVF